MPDTGPPAASRVSGIGRGDTFTQQGLPELAADHLPPPQARAFSPVKYLRPVEA